MLTRMHSHWLHAMTHNNERPPRIPHHITPISHFTLQPSYKTLPSHTPSSKQNKNHRRKKKKTPQTNKDELLQQNVGGGRS